MPINPYQEIVSDEFQQTFNWNVIFFVVFLPPRTSAFENNLFLNKTVLLSIQNVLKLMGKKIFTFLH